MIFCNCCVCHQLIFSQTAALIHWSLKTITPELTMIWAQRAFTDFTRKAPPEAPAKLKDFGFGKQMKPLNWTDCFSNGTQCHTDANPTCFFYLVNGPSGHNLPLQKQSQRDCAEMKDLMEICCLWHAISPKIELAVGVGPHKQLQEMFQSGMLVGKTGYNFPENHQEPCIFCQLGTGAKNTVVWKFRATFT